MSISNHNREKSSQFKQNQIRHLVIIAGYYGFDNLGDEAILEELVNEVSLLVGKESIVVLSHNPEQTASLYGVRSVNRWHCLTWFSLLGKAKLLISGGGGLFQDRTGLGSVIFYGAQILFAHLRGVKVLIYAQGVGPLQRALSNALTRAAFQQANKITVRDPNSLALLKKWGLQAQLTADPVWSLQSTELPEPIKKMLATLKTANEGRMLVGLSLRDDPQLQNYHLEFLAKSIAVALPAQSAILFLPLQKERDQSPLQSIEQFLSGSAINTHWLDPASLSRPSQWLALMENFDFLIGMRFHALLMALKANKPVIGIAYDQKVSQLLNDFSQPWLSLNTNKDECENIWSKTINDAIDKRDGLANTIKNKLILSKQLADNNMKSLAEILEVSTKDNVTSNQR